MCPSLPPDASRASNAQELQKRLDEHPNNRLPVITKFYAERLAAGDREGADYAILVTRLELEKENARLEHEREVTKLQNETETTQLKHEAEMKEMRRDQMSPLLKLMIVLGFITGVIFGLLGIWLVYLGATGATEVSFFGQTAKSTNVGIVSIFLGAAIIVLLMRSILKTIRSGS